METTSNKTLKSGIDLLITMIICLAVCLCIGYSKLENSHIKLQNSIDSVNVQIKELRLQLYNDDTITHKPNSITKIIKQIKYE